MWDDINWNGIQDPEEFGLWNITVELQDCFGGVIAETVTDDFGFYEFSVLPPGDYQLMFLLYGSLGASQQDQGGDDTLDSDVDSEGKTECFTIEAGENNDTVDAGLHESFQIISLPLTVEVGEVISDFSVIYMFTQPIDATFGPWACATIDDYTCLNAWLQNPSNVMSVTNFGISDSTATINADVTSNYNPTTKTLTFNYLNTGSNTAIWSSGDRIEYDIYMRFRHIYGSSSRILNSHIIF